MHHLNVKKKYYNLLKSGQKIIELRLFDKKRQQIKINDTIEFSNLSNPDDKFQARVIDLHRAKNFISLCQIIDCQKAGFTTSEELIKALSEFYSLEQQHEFGVVGIEVKTTTAKG